jgi:hypothetical protein
MTLIVKKPVNISIVNIKRYVSTNKKNIKMG